jgi:protein SCO1
MIFAPTHVGGYDFSLMHQKVRAFSAAVSLATLAVLTGWEQSPTTAPSGTDVAPPKTNYFEAKGVVTAVTPATRTIEIKHEAIAGYMGAMTMPFDVVDTNEMAGIAPGDPISFRLVVTSTNGWVDQIRKTGVRTNLPPATGPFRLVRDVEVLAAGDLLPEYHFTNEFNQPISTAQYKGEALAINFLFTRCPFPNFCPRTARMFAETEKALLTMPGGPTNWHLLTITIDPEFDTPAVLRNYAQTYNYDSNRWTFATGELIDITAIGEQFGLTFWRDETSGLPTHNLRTVVIDASGRVQDRLDGVDWESSKLIADMVQAAAK